MTSSAPPAADKRAAERVDVSWPVDCETDQTFLFASITNISALGIFVRTNEPHEIGSILRLNFVPSDGGEPFMMRGRVQWLNPLIAFGDNPNPGMGVMFLDLKPEERERLVATIRSIAYLRSDPITN